MTPKKKLIEVALPLGYDGESRVPGTGKLRFIEAKGRVSGAETITVTRNEVLYSLNKPDEFILAMVEFLEGDTLSALPSTTVSAGAGLPCQQRELRFRRITESRGGAAIVPAPP